MTKEEVQAFSEAARVAEEHGFGDVSAWLKKFVNGELSLEQYRLEHANEDPEKGRFLDDLILRRKEAT